MQQPESQANSKTEKDLAETIAQQERVIERLEERLEDINMRFRKVVTSIPLGLLVVTEGNLIAMVNSRVENIFGYDKDELAGKPLSFLFPSIETLELSAKSQTVIGQRKSGESAACELFVSEVEIDDDKRTFVHVLDVTERHRLEQLRKDFVAMVSHDLRTPLTSINMGLDMMEQGSCGELSEHAALVVKHAKSSSDYLISLVTELLDAEKMQSSEFEIELSGTSVRAVVDKALSATKAAAAKTKVAIESDITNDAFYADEDRIVQVLINLISNAVKYSPAGSEVLVKAGLEGAGLRFRVIDRGPGIPKQQHAVIFERYRQLAQPKGIKRRGFGLGLAICKALVEAHKGTIGVESEEGKGSTFWFFIPLLEASGEPL